MTNVDHAASTVDTNSSDSSSPTVDLMGVPISIVSRKESVDKIIVSLDEKVGGWLCTVNLDILRQVCHVKGVRELLAYATDYVADGRPILWAASLKGVRLPERVCGSDLIYDLTEAAAKHGKSVFFLGGNSGTADAAAVELKRCYPQLQVAGTYCPEFGFEKNPDTMQQIRSMIIESKPDIVYVALGFPKQEKLIKELRDANSDPWYIGVGISFSFVTGEVQRAPRWMQLTGIEWLHRLLQEPGRLWKRYLVHDVPFAIELLWKCYWSPRIQPDPTPSPAPAK